MNLTLLRIVVAQSFATTFARTTHDIKETANATTGCSTKTVDGQTNHENRRNANENNDPRRYHHF